MADPRKTIAFQRLRQALKDQRLPCAICGQDIDYDAPPNEPQSFEADHIIPIKERPDLALDPANLQATHSICNRRKNKYTQPLSIGLTSRTW